MEETMVTRYMEYDIEAARNAAALGDHREMDFCYLLFVMDLCEALGGAS